MKLAILSLIFAGLLAAECPTPPPCMDGALCYTEFEGCRYYARYTATLWRAEQVWDTGESKPRWVWTLESWVLASQPAPQPVGDDLLKRIKFNLEQAERNLADAERELKRLKYNLMMLLMSIEELEKRK